MKNQENIFGYIRLYDAENDRDVFVKANAITSISRATKSEQYKNCLAGSLVYTSKEDFFYTKETPEKIFEQLENIHPSMR